MKRQDFGNSFLWGTATASYQIEGAHDVDEKSASIWDHFSSQKGKIKDGTDGKVACDFYQRYPQDISVVKELGFDVFRFSLAWTRIMRGPKVNSKGLDFYKKVIDECLKNDVQPWVTLYHWDLPQSLQDKGGWKNRDIIQHFSDYVDVCTQELGDVVKNWMIFNEPSVFTTMGYLTGQHAPGEIGWFGFLKAAHHVVLSQAAGGNIARNNVKDGSIGTTFSMTDMMPCSSNPKDIRATEKLDAIVNRMFLEPALGLGYPVKSNPLLKRIEKYFQDGDENRMKFDFDFIGLQNYTRNVIQRKWWVPFIGGLPISAGKISKEPLTDMGWEVYPQGIYHLMKKLNQYDNIPKIIITENGSAFPDQLVNGRVHDTLRQNFFERYLSQVLKAKQEGVPVEGYFVWSLLDNFEWAEGYRPRFGIVHVDYATQERTIKDSGWWWKDFLTS